MPGWGTKTWEKLAGGQHMLS